MDLFNRFFEASSGSTSYMLPDAVANNQPHMPISGDLLRLMNELDALFCSWASEIGAQEHLYPPLLPVDKLHMADHFASFPHQAIFAVAAERAEENLRCFSKNPLNEDSSVNMPKLAATHFCLSPGACFPIYFGLQGQALIEPSYITVRSPCFRREDSNEPLRRQMSFNMREIVCIGTELTVNTFLENFRERVTELFDSLGLPVCLEHAVDPFFSPKSNRKYLMQKIMPLKHEMVFQDDLAIGSLNNHLTGFGKIFDISVAGEIAHSGCVAFGLERWLYAFLDHFGDDSSGWPDLKQSPGNMV